MMDFPPVGRFTEHIACTVSPEVRARLEAIAKKKTGGLLSPAIRRLIDAGLEVYDQEQEEKA